MVWRRYLVCVAAFAAMLTARCAGVSGAKHPEPWRGEFIGLAETADEMNTWICFRKEFELPEKPVQAAARVAVDSKYWLWVNGQIVVFEGQLKRGPTPADTYYDEVNLAEYLRQGENTIAILVWYWGKDGFSHKSSGRCGLVFEADIDGRIVPSDKTWRARRHPAYFNPGGMQPNYRLPEPNVGFDARKDIGEWMGPAYDDSDWQQATEFGRPPAAPWNRLLKRPIPLWKDYGLKAYVNDKKLPRNQWDDRPVACELPYNAQVTPYLRINAPAGKIIDIRTDHYTGGGPYNFRAEYVTEEGVQEYESLGWMSGHKVIYGIPHGVQILSLKYRETGYNTEFAGVFECDDEFFNMLWEKAARTLYITMRDTYMDCPERERAQWWGDAVIEIGESFYALDANSRLLAKKGIYELVNWQRNDGVLHSPIPGSYEQELPMQMLASVGWHGFWNYYMHTGDRETIRYAYPAVRKYLDVWKIGDEGLVVPRKGDWTWGDWGENKDMLVLYNCWYYLALKGAAAMAEVTGHQSDIAGYEGSMRSIRENFNGAFWNGSEYRSAAHQGQTDDRANAMAVVSGLADEEKYRGVKNVLATQFHASPYMEKYVLESLFLMGDAGAAMQRMKKRYGDIVASELTTLPEVFADTRKITGTNNHAWSGGPLTLLSQYAAGIGPVEPGYEVFEVKPRMGRLRHIKARVASVVDIEVEMQRDEKAFVLKLNSPADTRAVVGVPRGIVGDIVSISINGTTVWPESPGAAEVEGVGYVASDGPWHEFSVEPGSWVFRAVSE